MTIQTDSIGDPDTNQAPKPLADPQQELNEGRWPYSKFSLGYIWWLLTQKGRVECD